MLQKFFKDNQLQRLNLIIAKKINDDFHIKRLFDDIVDTKEIHSFLKTPNGRYTISMLQYSNYFFPHHFAPVRLGPTQYADIKQFNDKLFYGLIKYFSQSKPPLHEVISMVSTTWKHFLATKQIIVPELFQLCVSRTLACLEHFVSYT